MLYFDVKGGRIHRIFSSDRPLLKYVAVPDTHEGNPGDALSDFDEQGRRIPLEKNLPARQASLLKGAKRARFYLKATADEYWESVELGETLPHRIKELRRRSWAVIRKTRATLAGQ